MQGRFLLSSMISAAPAELTVVTPEEVYGVQFRAIRDIRGPHIATLDGLAFRLVQKWQFTKYTQPGEYS
jgi:hypothetical protein